MGYRSIDDSSCGDNESPEMGKENGANGGNGKIAPDATATPRHAAASLVRSDGDLEALLQAGRRLATSIGPDADC